MLIIFALVIILVIIIWIKPYLIKYDTVCGFTGGLGCGKTFESVNVAIRELRKNRLKTRIYNTFCPLFKRKKLEKPLLYSSIPVRISKKEMSEKLTIQHLLLQERIVKGSIVFLDEVDVWANQFAHANPNVIEIISKKEVEKGDFAEGGIFDEHMRLFRHYHASECCEPKLIVNTQATSNIITIIRRRICSVYVQSKFRVIKIPILHRLPFVGGFFKFYTYLVREITISDDIQNTSNDDIKDSFSRRLAFMPRIRHYDTHCYSDRVTSLIPTQSEKWDSMKTNRLLKCPIKRYDNKCTDE